VFCIAKLREGRNRLLRLCDGSGSLTLNSKVSKCSKAIEGDLERSFGLRRLRRSKAA